MKSILCYGDSNTYGFNPVNAERFDEDIRWSSLLKSYLGEEWNIIEEGLNNRTGFVDNPDGFIYSAQRHFPKIIGKMKNINIIILAVGTNDLQFQFDISFKTIENCLERLILLAKQKSDRIILVPPVTMNEDILNGYFKIQFDETSISKSKKVGRIYRKLAGIFGCEVFDFNDLTGPSSVDGLHYDEKSHKIIAEKLKEFIVFPQKKFSQSSCLQVF